MCMCVILVIHSISQLSTFLVNNSNNIRKYIAVALLDITGHTVYNITHIHS